MNLDTLDTGQIIIWIIVGGLSGSLAAMLVTRSREGFGLVTNLLVGLIGAVVGGYLFEVLEIDLNLGEIQVTAEDLVAAFIGSLLLIVVVDLLRRRM